MVITKKILALSLVATLMSGCSSVQKSLSFIPGVPNPDTTKVRKVFVKAGPNANQNSAVEMDVLFILDKDLAKTLPTTASEWFDERSRYLANNRQTILPAPVGLPPKGKNKVKLPKGYKKAEDVIAYANYFSSKGQKWLRLPNSKSVSIELGTLNWEFSSTAK